MTLIAQAFFTEKYLKIKNEIKIFGPFVFVYFLVFIHWLIFDRLSNLFITDMSNVAILKHDIP